MRNTNLEASGTSFHGVTIMATVAILREILGVPFVEQNNGWDKVNFDWKMETEDGDIFTVYDWKEYRMLEPDELIRFHIGARRGEVTLKAREEMLEVINSMPAIMKGGGAI